jgi:Transcriptional regulator, contains sigma factor-related N-terminal domain
LTKERLEQLQYIETAIDLIKTDIKETDEKIKAEEAKPGIPSKGKCSMAEFPYIETSYDFQLSASASMEKLKRKMVEKNIELNEELAALEDWLNGVKDFNLQNILRLRYRNGLTQEQIADELGYTRSAIAMILKRFWEEGGSE